MVHLARIFGQASMTSVGLQNNMFCVQLMFPLLQLLVDNTICQKRVNTRSISSGIHTFMWRAKIYFSTEHIIQFFISNVALFHYQDKATFFVILNQFSWAIKSNEHVKCWNPKWAKEIEFTLRLWSTTKGCKCWTHVCRNGSKYCQLFLHNNVYCCDRK